jgi:SulP family sulfate permease
VLRDAIERLEHRGITVLLSGIQPGHAKILEAIGVSVRQDRVFGSTSEAIAAARRLLCQSGVITASQPRQELANATRTTR